MAEYIELIDKYRIEQSKDTDYNQPSYEWVDNTGKIVRCRDCIHFQQFRAHDGFCQIDGMLWNNDFFCANGKIEES